MRSIEDTLAAHTSLHVAQQLRFGASDATTLSRWRQRIEAQADAIDALGFDAVFRRMWSFYLAYSEAGFRGG